MRVLWLTNSVMEDPAREGGGRASLLQAEGWASVGAELAWIWSAVREDPHAHALAVRMMTNFIGSVQSDPNGAGPLRSVAMPVAGSVLSSCLESFSENPADEEAVEASADLWLRILQVVQSQRLLGAENEVSLSADLLEMLGSGVAAFLRWESTRAKACWILEGNMLLLRVSLCDSVIGLIRRTKVTKFIFIYSLSLSPASAKMF